MRGSKKTRKKALELNMETVRQLDGLVMQAVAGGNGHFTHATADMKIDWAGVVAHSDCLGITARASVKYQLKGEN